MTINVEVRFFGVFQHLSGKKCLQLKLKDPTMVKDIVEKITETLSDEFKRALIDPQLNDPRMNSLILVGGKEISALQGLETEIKGDEEIVFIPMVHGG
jgi:molybdopterin converting factor small subunit